MALVKCEEEATNRCQASHQNGQCVWCAVPEGSYCEAHGGNKLVQAKIKERNRMFDLAHWNARVGDFAAHSEIKSLNTEIGILRIMLEKILVRAQDGNDLTIYSSQITNLIMNIQKLVLALHKIEISMKSLLSKEQVANLADAILGVIIEHVDDPDKINQISDKILAAIVGQVLN